MAAHGGSDSDEMLGNITQSESRCAFINTPGRGQPENNSLGI